MRNKLRVPEENPTYKWLKTDAVENYSWNTFNAIPHTKYYWKQFNDDKSYTVINWDKYEATPAHLYAKFRTELVTPFSGYGWNKRVLFPSGSTEFAWHYGEVGDIYVWNTYFADITYHWNVYESADISKGVYGTNRDGYDYILGTDENVTQLRNMSRFRTEATGVIGFYDNTTDEIQLDVVGSITRSGNTVQISYSNLPTTFNVNKILIPVLDRTGNYYQIGISIGANHKCNCFPTSAGDNVLTLKFNTNTNEIFMWHGIQWEVKVTNPVGFVATYDSTTKSDYPDGGYITINNVEYVIDNYSETGEKGAQRSERVKNADRNAFPDDGLQRGTWYEIDLDATEQGLTRVTRVLRSYYADAYENGKTEVIDGITYIYKFANTSTTTKDGGGNIIEEVHSNSATAYPENGAQGGFYYESLGYIFRNQNRLKASYIGGGYGLPNHIYYSAPPTYDRQERIFIFDESTRVENPILPNVYYVAMPSSRISSYVITTPFTYTTDTSAQNFIQITTEYISEPTEEDVELLGFVETPEAGYNCIDTEDYYLKGDFIESVTEGVGRYIYNEVYNGYWYVRTSEEASHQKGSYAGEVYTIDNPNKYPQDGFDEITKFWYEAELDKTEPYYEKGSRIGDIIADSRSAYPDDGVADDIYYVFKEAFWVDTHENPTEVESYNIDDYPENGGFNNHWYLYEYSYYKDLFTIDDRYIMGGVNYQQEINTADDLEFGIAGCAEIKLTVLNEDGIVDGFINRQFDYFVMQDNDTDWRAIGKFIIKDLKKNKRKVELTCYDVISKLDTNVDDFIEEAHFPMKLKDLAKALGEYCGVNIFFSVGAVNTNEYVYDNFTSTNMTGRDILQYMAQMSACFAVANTVGEIVIKPFTEKNINIDNHKYVEALISDYEIKPIDKVQVRMEQDDIGVIYGDGSNALIIENNPLFYSNSDYEIRNKVINIYNAVKDLQYYLTEIQLLQDFGINCGDIITIDGLTTYIMKKEYSASGVKLYCNGNYERLQQQDSINTSLNALRGKYNYLSRTLDETVSQLGDAEQNVSEIAQKVDSLQISVSNQDETSIISLKAGETVISSAEVQMNGMVTFNDLERSGSTVINGNNIRTGQISGDRIDADSLYINSANITGSIKADEITTNSIFLSTNGGISSYDGSAGPSKTNGIQLNGNGGVIAVSNAGAKMSYGDSEFSVYQLGAQMKGRQIGINGTQYITMTSPYISASSEIHITSDRRNKHNIDYDIDKYEEVFNDLKPCEFIYNINTEEKTETGFIAQDVNDSLAKAHIENSNLVSHRDAIYDQNGNLVSEEQYALSYSNLIAINTMMIQKLQKRVAELETQIESMKENSENE